MWKFLDQFRRDENGSVMAAEWVVVATILMLGAVAGLVSARAALLSDPNAPAASSR
jgi:Flp pilus assembly pilin Flp